LTGIYQAIVDRIFADSSVKNYFADFKIKEEPEVFDKPYLRMSFKELETLPVTVPINREVTMTFEMTIGVVQDDEDLFDKELLRALEIVINAVEKQDLTYSNRIIQTEFNIDDTVQLNDKNRVSKGNFIVTSQPYERGSL